VSAGETDNETLLGEKFRANLNLNSLSKASVSSKKYSGSVQRGRQELPKTWSGGSLYAAKNRPGDCAGTGREDVVVPGRIMPRSERDLRFCPVMNLTRLPVFKLNSPDAYSFSTLTPIRGWGRNIAPQYFEMMGDYFCR
jgi:hypothetical protein